MSGAYLDASALVKLVVTERETAALRTFLRGHSQRFTNRVAVVEVTRAVRRRDARRSATLKDAFEGVAVIELDSGITERAGVLEPAALRALDAMHLATALALAEEVAVFVTYDTRQADAARELGLAVEAPS